MIEILQRFAGVMGAVFLVTACVGIMGRGDFVVVGVLGACGAVLVMLALLPS